MVDKETLENRSPCIQSQLLLQRIQLFNVLPLILRHQLENLNNFIQRLKIHNQILVRLDEFNVVLERDQHPNKITELYLPLAAKIPVQQSYHLAVCKVLVEVVFVDGTCGIAVDEVEEFEEVDFVLGEEGLLLLVDEFLSADHEVEEGEKFLSDDELEVEFEVFAGDLGVELAGLGEG